MAQYIVRSGQNIYDVALTLHGSVEGIFDLLVSNEWLNMETPLKYGMILNYHKEFSINQDISIWLKNNDVIVKNGDHPYYFADIEMLVKNHITTFHPEILSSVSSLSSDEQSLFWENQYSPKIIIHQQGVLTNIGIRLKNDTHLIVDWGDYSIPQIFEGENYVDIEHCYKGSGIHIITLYGNFECHTLDFKKLNGIFYPLNTIHADEFLSDIEIKDLTTLIITK